MRRVFILTNFGRKKRYTFENCETNLFILFNKRRNVGTTHAAIKSTNGDKAKNAEFKTKEGDTILHRFSSPSACPTLNDYYQYNTNDLIKVLNVYIKYKNDNVELLRNISINLLMNKEKLRYKDIVILLKQFSIIKCKNYFLFCYFKDVLSENIHILGCDALVDVYFAFTNLNYFHYNFFFLIEKRIFHNFHLLNLKKLVCLIQCFNKKKIITKNYLTILLYSISKNINQFNTFQLSVLFAFFKNFNINNNILINSLIHNFNEHVNVHDDSKNVAIFYNFLSYVSKKCHKNYHYFVKEKELIGLIKNFNFDYDEEWEVGIDQKEEEDDENVNRQIVETEQKYKPPLGGETCMETNNSGEILKVKLSNLENNFLYKSKELETLREKTNALKQNSYNVSLVYSIKNALKSVEEVTKKKLKNMPIESLCLISSSIVNIDKNKFLLEKIAEEVGKQSTKLTPSLVSCLLLSFSKANHKHGSLIYYSLQFFYKYYNFFSVNEVGLLCKALNNFSLKENEFVDVLNVFILSNLTEGIGEAAVVSRNDAGEEAAEVSRNDDYSSKQTDMGYYLNYNAEEGPAGGRDMEKLFLEIERSIDKSIERRNYEDEFINLRNAHMEDEKGKKESKRKGEGYENKMKYKNFVNLSFIDYENIKKNNYYVNNLYNIKMSNSMYINNIIYILEYYAFNLVNITEILNLFCDIFLKRNINYILYSRIFYAFHMLQYRENKIYELINKFNNSQPVCQVMYKERHMMKLLESLIYFYESKSEDTKMEDIYFYVLSKSYFSFIFNFSKYILTFLFVKNNNYVLHKFLVDIRDISLGRGDYIYLHKPKRLY
ncbi:hypothetical protein, conserved [Plasmodium gonderi]|uniref:Uncharacterized protein n=1 Tax=Plasmodium gonderi TaxID=77519 RepID=A0A1Y1JMG0_PLAGO|nr:hypothetical protein, conserved [Plasmodium gonderi]GAW81573.1 hypothetical protein, conserved [Plasmodium gonderi]